MSLPSQNIKFNRRNYHNNDLIYSFSVVQNVFSKNHINDLIHSQQSIVKTYFLLTYDFPQK